MILLFYVDTMGKSRYEDTKMVTGNTRGCLDDSFYQCLDKVLTLLGL